MLDCTETASNALELSSFRNTLAVAKSVQIIQIFYKKLESKIRNRSKN